MTLELKPKGNSCNINCVYCYQDPMRKAGNTKTTTNYDLNLMMDIADKSDRAFQGGYTVFGGEGLLVPKEDLERIFARSYEKYKKSGIQTNGSLIDDDHIEMFKKYNVSVGVSIDGDGDLNELRQTFDPSKTNEATNKTIEAMKKLINNEIIFGLIITVHRSNGTPEKLPQLMNFIRWLGDIGISTGILHMMEVDSEEASHYSLTSDENEYAFMELLRFFNKLENKDLSYAPFTDMKKMLGSNNDRASCVWSSCNAADTESVYGIEGNGQLSNCGMVNKEGIEWTKADGDQIYFRDLVLYQTPQELGGCQGCEFFILCNGYCNGSSINSDWRNRTVHCNTIKSIFKYQEEELESEGIVPFSKRIDRKQLENIYITNLLKNNRLPISELEKLSEDNKIIVKVIQTPETKESV
jgi:uncharacterized protein